jgi:ABC-type amino acid transport system permease subunit
MLPSLGARLAQHVKDTTLASTIAVTDLVFAGATLEGETNLPFPIYTGLMIVFFGLSWGAGFGPNLLYRHLAHRARA